MPQREENKREYFKKIVKEMGQPKRDPIVTRTNKEEKGTGILSKLRKRLKG